MTYDKRFGELIQQNDNSGKNSIFLFQKVQGLELKPLAACSFRFFGLIGLICSISSV
jgi:hypothetical protein